MDNGRLLLLVPPSNILDLDSTPFQRGLGLLDLGLVAAMRQNKGQSVVEENFHTAWCNPEGDAG
jgi:hypothetical protein